MTNTLQTTSPLPFTPLGGSSQNTSNPVLYYNPNAALDDIYECAMARINAVINLCENIYELKTEPSAVCALASVSAILLNDAITLLEELNPTALQLRQESQP